MGAVYEAEDARTGAHVALKLMHGEQIKRDSTRVGRFQREAKAAAAIDSEHIARVLDWGTDDLGAPYIVMELLAGEDLQELLKRTGALPPEVALRIAAQACLGLSKAHEAHVMHRDIKPANLFLARRGDGRVVVKILDFGVAKIRPEGEHGQETTGLTRTGGMIGSPMYMSPEQARGLKAVDFRTDLWSLGVVMYRALTGHTPHEDTEALGDLIVSLCSRAPAPIQDIAAWVPPEIAAIAHGALQIAPEARFTDARAMLEAMRALLPQGDALTESALVPIDAARRSVIAMRLSETTADPSAPGVVGRTPAPSISDDLAVRPAQAMTTAAGQQVNASTGAPVVPTRPPPPPATPVRWTAVVIAGVIAVVGFGAFGVLRATSPTAGAGVPDAGSPATQEPAPSAPASAVPRVAPAAEPARRVMLVVMPAGVSADVDGAPTRVQDGTVEIEGALGSVHHVRVYRGRVEVAADVTVTDSGAVPPKLELGHGAPGIGKAPAGPASAAPAASKPRGTGNPLMPDRFE
jgi:eukaryotic-like serine/threonine-protein kinase